MLSGRYPSDEFAELRPRLTWDRARGPAHARARARGGWRSSTAAPSPIAASTACSSPAAGGAAAAASASSTRRWSSRRRAGETFLLGASTWRIEEITHDRVLVSPAPGEPGKMPFWKGDGPGRPLEFGRAHRRARARAARAAAARRPGRGWSRAPRPRRAGGREPAPLPRRPGRGDRRRARRPHDRHRALPRRARRLARLRALALRRPVHAPWAMAVAARAARATRRRRRDACGPTTASSLRLPETDAAARRRRSSSPSRTRSRTWSLASSARTALFAAASARRPAARCSCRGAAPAGARRCGSSASAPPTCWRSPRATPASRSLLETYRECLRDVFDLPALGGAPAPTCGAASRGWSRSTPQRALALRRLAALRLRRRTSSTTATPRWPSAARRRSPSTRRQLRELLGEAELRELLDADALVDAGGAAAAPRPRAARPQRRRPARPAAAPRRPHARRDARPAAAAPEVAASLDELRRRRRRVVPLRVGGRGALRRRSRTPPATATRSARRCRRASRRRCSGRVDDAARRAGRPLRAHATALHHRRAGGALRPRPRPRPRPRSTSLLARGPAAGGRLPAGRHASASGATPRCCARCAGARWRGCARRSSRSSRRAFARAAGSLAGRRRPGAAGLDALLDAIEKLQGAPLPASLLETRDPARRAWRATAAATSTRWPPPGEVVWVGLEPLGERDGRVALYLADAFARLPPAAPAGARAAGRRGAGACSPSSARRGASFFAELHEAAGGGFEPSTPSTRSGAWSGAGWSPTTPSRRCAPTPSSRARPGERRRRSAPRRARAPLAAGRPPRRRAGRWTLRGGAPGAAGGRARRTPTEWSAAAAQQLLARYGLVTRGVAAAEGLPGGFSRGLRRVPPPRGGRPHPARLLRGRAWARCSSRSPARSTCCARCARRPRRPRCWCSPRPIRPTPTARSCAGRPAPRATARGGGRPGRSARGSCSWTARSRRLGAPRGGRAAPRLAAGRRAGALDGGRGRGGRGVGPRARGAGAAGGGARGGDRRRPRRGPPARPLPRRGGLHASQRRPAARPRRRASGHAPHR